MAQGCPCSDPGKRCECGLLGTCEDRQCVSQECAWLDLTECTCPRTGGHCSTCCKAHNGSCVRAYALADEMKDRLDLQRFSPQEPPTGLANKLELCGPKSCFHVWFRRWKENGPCVYKSRLGKCVSGRCVSLHPQPVNLFSISSQTHEHDRGSVVCAVIVLYVLISIVY